MKKSELRHKIRLLKKQFDTAQMAAMSEAACLRVLSHPRWEQAHTVLLYASLPDEVDTTLLLSAGINKGKRLLLPVVIGDALLLKFFSGKFRVGDFGIREPEGETFTDYDQIDLAVIPGMAFNRLGNRLGRGRGYYDRFLPQINAYKIGLCFPFQLVESVPVDLFDQPVNEVITR